MWAGHYLQLWEGILHPGWAGPWWWAPGNQQEECAESDCGPGLAARGQ